MTSIYEYKKFSKFLFAFLKQKKAENSKYSYRYICRICQLQSPSTITDIVKDRRQVTHDILERLNAFLCLDSKEMDYAFVLVDLDRAKAVDSKQKLLERLRQLTPPKEQIVVAAHAKDALAKWYNLVITQLLNLPEASADPKWISARLGGRISPQQAKASVEAMLELGILKETEKGVKCVHDQFEVFSEGVPAAAGRQFHAEMMDIASEAIHIQPVSERYFGSNTFTVRKSDIKQIQEDLYKFRLQLQEKYAGCGDGEEVYHFAMQFFRLSEKPE